MPGVASIRRTHQHHERALARHLNVSGACVVGEHQPRTFDQCDELAERDRWIAQFERPGLHCGRDVAGDAFFAWSRGQDRSQAAAPHELVTGLRKVLAGPELARAKARSWGHDEQTLAPLDARRPQSVVQLFARLVWYGQLERLAAVITAKGPRDPQVALDHRDRETSAPFPRRIEA